VTHANDASAKAVLRMQVRGLRRAFVKDHPEADWQVGDKAEAMLKGLFGRRPGAGVAAIYRASGSEIDPRPLGEQLLAMGWTLALPASEGVDEPVVFRAWKPGDRLAPDVVGIAAPLASAPEVRPRIIVCPLIAFDRRGGRLGQGGGYYDRTIELARASPKPPWVVGLGFSIQEVARVPVEPHDQRLDAILTEKAFIPVAKDF
jgi:5-formyltetrahydrofolate cyclo-ligase